MNLLKILKKMFLYSPFKITFIWILDFINIAVLSATPWIMGLAIDGLVKREFNWFYVFIAIEALMLIVGTINRYFDTRIYSNLIKEFSTNYYDKEIKKDTDISAIDARLQLIDDFSGFLEAGLFGMLNTAIGIVVSLIYLYREMPLYILMLAIVISAIVLFITLKFKKKMMVVNKELKNHNENQQKIIRKRKTSKYKQYLDTILKLGIKNSDLDSCSFFFATLMQMGLLVSALYITILNENLLAGTILAIMSYIANLNADILEISDHWLYIADLKDSAKRVGDFYK